MARFEFELERRAYWKDLGTGPRPQAKLLARSKSISDPACSAICFARAAHGVKVKAMAMSLGKLGIVKLVTVLLESRANE